MSSRDNNNHPLVAPKRSQPPKKPKRVKGNGLFSGLFRRKARKAPKAPPKAKGNVVSRGISHVFRSVFGLVWWIASRSVIAIILILAVGTGYYLTTLPDDARVLMDSRTRGSVTILDHKGQVFAWRGDQFGGLITPDTVSPHLANAVVATEDKRFFRHLGISPRGIMGAIRINLREGRSALSGNGGSTITQQVAKLVFFSDLPTMERKAKEVFMAFALELKYSKNEVLAIYLNRAYLGAGSHGFEAASQRYFGKSAGSVQPSEAAMLAGLLKAPSRFAPTRNLGRAQGRAGVIVGLMKDQGYLSEADAADAIRNPARLSQAAEARAGGYFADWIMDSGPEFLIKDTTEDVRIRTTFDGRIQRAAETALRHVFENKVRAGSKAQAAIVVMSRDGAVRGMVGGRRTGNAGDFNRATQALRQTGSSFKPFVYAAALEDGLKPNSTVNDAPLTMNIPGSGNWSPRNYTGKYLGEITLTTALAKSINTAAVRVSENIGREKVRALARDFGVQNDIAKGPAVALGASESTLLEMTGAYAGFLNSGLAATPYGLLEVTLLGDDDPLMGQSGGTGHRVINKRAAQDLVYMMHQVVEDGTGKRAKLGERPAAGKTGTTQGARDAWFIGFTADYVAGVWMGYDDNSKLTGVTGGGLPAEIWRETMVRVHQGLPIRPLPMRVPRRIIIPTPTNPTQPSQPRTSNGQSVNDKIEEEIKRIERDAETILQRVLGDLFRRNRRNDN